MDNQSDILGALEKLASLRASGALSDDEFRQAKLNLLDERVDADPRQQASAEAVVAGDWDWVEGEGVETIGQSPPKWLLASLILLFLGGVAGSIFVASSVSEAEAAMPEEAEVVSSPEVPVASSYEAEESSSAQSLMPEPTYTALLTCRYGGEDTYVSLCLFGTGGADVHGELKVSRDGDVKQYDAMELSQMFENQISIDLGSTFGVIAQSGADENAVLRLEILEGGRLVYEDEASMFGVIGVGSEDLHE